MTIPAMVFGVIVYFLNALLKKCCKRFYVPWKLKTLQANQFQAYLSALLVPLPAKV